MSRNHTLRGRGVALIALVASLALAGCAAPSAPPDDADGPLAGQTIAYIQTYSNPYYDGTANGVTAAAESLGADTIVLQSNFDPITERANVQDAITKQVAAVVLEPVTAEGTRSLLDLLDEAGIPAVVLYGYSDDVRDLAAGFVQVDYTETGALMGAALADAVPEGDVAVITGALGRGDAETMLAGFEDAFGDDSRVVSVLDGGWDRQKAYDAALDLITKTPDLKGLFVMNEPMAAGAIQALGDKAAGVTIVSQNGSPEGLEMIQGGQLTATSAWSPVYEGVIAVRILADLLAGNPLDDADKVCLVPLVAVTADNLDESPSWEASDSVVSDAFDTACKRPE